MKKKKKIFFVTTELPSRTGGPRVRNFNLIKNLKRKYAISLFTIVDEKSERILPSVKKELSIPIYTTSAVRSSTFGKLVSIAFLRTIPYMIDYQNSKISTLLINEINKQKPDIVQVQQLNTYYAIKSLIPSLKKNNIKIVLDQHNVEYIAFLEGIKSMPLIKMLAGLYLLPKLKKIEHDAVKTADHVFTCSHIDKKYFQEKLQINTITVIPNGVDCNYFKPITFADQNTLLFMGSTSYPPNNEALKYFFNRIYPILQVSIANISIYILGDNPAMWLRELSKKDTSIKIVNHAADVRSYINRAKICICPVLSGSGTRLKVLEYLGSGKAVVSTRKGAEGIDITNSTDILIADSAEEFAKKIKYLFLQPRLTQVIGANARKLILEKYQWKNIVNDMENAYV